MAWLLFLDESLHDHKQMPYEVRGGIALQDSQLWPFTRVVQQLERECFGCSLSLFQKELKGSTGRTRGVARSCQSLPRGSGCASPDRSRQRRLRYGRARSRSTD